MTTYFVATNGNDNNSGSQSLPFATFKKGLESMVAGDTLQIRGGTYAQAIRGFEINIPSGVSYTNAITVQNFSGETVTLVSNGATLIDLNYFTSGLLHYVIFDGLHLNGQVVGQPVFFDGINVHHIRFKNLEIFNSNNQGISGFDGSDSIEIIACNIHNNGTTFPFDHGVYIATPNLLIDGCNIHDNNSYGVQIYHSGSTTNQSNGTIIRNNIIHNNNYGGTTLNHGNGLDFYNNIVHNNVVNGVEISYNNINFRAYNNTIYGNNTAVVLGDANVQNAVITNNIFWQNSTNGIVSNGATFTASNNMTTDPRFVNQTLFDFHLTNSSPAINSGTTSLFSPTDFDGVLRVLPPDIGAYEFVSVIAPLPITCDDSRPWVLLSTGVFANTSLMKTVTFSPYPARWVCFRALSEVNGNPWTSCAELSILVDGRQIVPTPPTHLVWDYAQDMILAVKFNVYRQTNLAGGFILIGSVDYPTLEYFDTTVMYGNIYDYEITAVDAFNLESSISNIVEYVPNRVGSVWCFDSEELVGEGADNGHAIHCIDGLTTTFWHTRWTSNVPGYPHNIVLDLGHPYSINGFTYLPRQDGVTNGTVASYEFYVADYFISIGRLMTLPSLQPMLSM
jgi:hypothetical protein